MRHALQETAKRLREGLRVVLGHAQGGRSLGGFLHARQGQVGIPLDPTLEQVMVFRVVQKALVRRGVANHQIRFHPGCQVVGIPPEGLVGLPIITYPTVDGL
ncbi:hypothetical protein D3C72_988090 [compost metagenome]